MARRIARAVGPQAGTRVNIPPRNVTKARGGSELRRAAPVTTPITRNARPGVLPTRASPTARARTGNRTRVRRTRPIG